MSYTVKYDAGEIQDNITTIDKPTLQIDSPRNSKGEITATEIDLTFADPAVDGESATLIKNNLKLANLNRGAIVLDQDTTENSITVDNLESSTAYQATLTQYAEEQIEAYSKVDFSTAQEAPFSISTNTITLKQGASVEIPFTNDGCSLTTFTDYNLINVVQNSNTFGLTAVTDDMGSDHLTIVATKNGFMPKTVQMTVIVPDVTIECSPLAISIDGDVDEYKDVVVTTNGDSISYSINNDNCSVELLSTSQDGLTATYRVTGESDGGSVITFNALVDGNVVESCTCGVTLSNIVNEQVLAFTVGANISNVNMFYYEGGKGQARLNLTGFNVNDYDVYINNVKTSQKINSLTANANDKIVIRASNENVRCFPFPMLGYVYCSSIDAPFPKFSTSGPNASGDSKIGTEFENYSGVDVSLFRPVNNCSITTLPRKLFKNNAQATNIEVSLNSLITIPNDLFRYNTNAKTISLGGSSITELPQDLFRYNTEVTTFTVRGDFTTLPQDLFRYNTEVTTFYYCFNHCSSLTSIPQDLFKYNTKVTNFRGCFYSCTSLTSIPENLFKYNTDVTSFMDCFYNCTSLTSIPQDLFKYNTNVTTFEACFRQCTSITLIPEDLFKYNTDATNFSYCFYYSSNITTIPQNLFKYNTKITTLFDCFSKCTNVTSAVPELWVSHPDVDSRHCFEGCTSASNYADIPSGWK